MATAMEGVIPGTSGSGTEWSSSRPMADMGPDRGKSWVDPDELDGNYATRIHRTVRVSLPLGEETTTKQGGSGCRNQCQKNHSARHKRYISTNPSPQGHPNHEQCKNLRRLLWKRWRQLNEKMLLTKIEKSI
jgi:hypothetical protein